jgi:hypothetical protein
MTRPGFCILCDLVKAAIRCVSGRYSLCTANFGLSTQTVDSEPYDNAGGWWIASSRSYRDRVVVAPPVVPRVSIDLLAA